MIYYYNLFRFHISQKIHMRNKIKMEKSWKEVQKYQYRLRKNRMKYIEIMKKYKINNLS